MTLSKRMRCCFHPVPASLGPDHALNVVPPYVPKKGYQAEDVSMLFIDQTQILQMVYRPL